MFAKFIPKILKFALAVLGTLGLSAVSGAVSVATKKAVSGGAVRHVAVRRSVRKGATKV